MKSITLYQYGYIMNWYCLQYLNVIFRYTTVSTRNSSASFFITFRQNVILRYCKWLICFLLKYHKTLYVIQTHGQNSFHLILNHALRFFSIICIITQPTLNLERNKCKNLWVGNYSRKTYYWSIKYLSINSHSVNSKEPT